MHIGTQIMPIGTRIMGIGTQIMGINTQNMPIGTRARYLLFSIELTSWLICKGFLVSIFWNIYNDPPDRTFVWTILITLRLYGWKIMLYSTTCKQSEDNNDEIIIYIQIL